VQLQNAVLPWATEPLAVHAIFFEAVARRFVGDV